MKGNIAMNDCRINEITKTVRPVLDRIDINERAKENVINGIQITIMNQDMITYLLDDKYVRGYVIPICAPRYNTKSKPATEKNAVVEVENYLYAIFANDEIIKFVKEENVSLVYSDGDVTIKDQKAYTVDPEEIPNDCVAL